MELQSKAQDLSYAEIVVDDNEPVSMVLAPIPTPEDSPFVEIVENSSPSFALESGSEVYEPGQVEIVVEDFKWGKDNIPGLKDKLDPAREQLLEIIDEPEEEKKDDNDARKKIKKDEWDWESKGGDGFLEWVKDRFDKVPKHSGYDSAGLERAVSYLEKLDNEISKAMRLDLDGKLDADKIEDIRAKIEDGIDRLHERLEKIKRKKSKKKKADFIADETLVKEAQKAAGVRGIYVMAPLFISCIARILINGHVSAGHDMNDMFKKLSNKYKLNDREKMETIQLLSDMGFPVRQDRGLIDDDTVDETSSDNFDWSAQYKA